MITESTLYWITRLDNFRIMFIVMLVVFAFAALIFVFSMTENSIREEERDFAKRLFVFLAIPLFFVSVLGLVFVPTTKEMCAIKVIPAIAQNEKIQGLGEKALALTKAWLDELKPSKKLDFMGAAGAEK